MLQEVLQGFAGPKNRDQLVERLSALAFLQPDKQDHIAAAEIRNVCRRRVIQIGTIDALLIQLCQRYELTLLTTDKDFQAASQQVEFRLCGTALGALFLRTPPRQFAHQTLVGGGGDQWRAAEWKPWIPDSHARFNGSGRWHPSCSR